MISVYDFSQIINSYLHEPHSSLLNGILFGIKLKTTEEFYLNLKKVGLLHIVVLSGMNLSLLSGIVSYLTFNLGRKISSVITIIVLILFILFVGADAPIVRAGIMAILTHVAIIYGYKTYTLYMLFLSAVFSLLIKPIWIKSISFQLSYLATLGLILFSRTYKQETKFWRKVLRFIKMEFNTSIAAQVFTAPLIFIYFKQISLISPITNILVAPVIAPIMISGMLTAFLGKINYFFGFPFFIISFGLVDYIVKIVEIFSSLPFSFFQFN